MGFSRWGDAFTLGSVEDAILGIGFVLGERPVSSDKLMLAGDERS